MLFKKSLIYEIKKYENQFWKKILKNLLRLNKDAFDGSFI